MALQLTLSRRDFVKAGGVLFVSAALPARFGGSTVEAAETLDPTQLKSWLEIHEDGRIIARTGKTEVGTNMSAYYIQAVAEELGRRAVIDHADHGAYGRDPGGRLLRGPPGRREQSEEGRILYAHGTAPPRDDETRRTCCGFDGSQRHGERRR